MSKAKIPVWNWRDAVYKSSAPPLTRFVCITIAHYLSDAGQSWRIPVKRLMADTGLSNSSIATHLANAVQLGLLAVTRVRNAKGHVTGTYYQAKFPANMTLSKEPATLIGDESLDEGGSLRDESLSERGPRGRGSRHSKITKGSSEVLSKEKIFKKAVPTTSLSPRTPRSAEVKEHSKNTSSIGSERPEAHGEPGVAAKPEPVKLAVSDAGQVRRFLPKTTPPPSSGIDPDLLRRAEGLGLPLDEMLAATDRANPDDPDGYFQGLCKRRLKRILPTASDALLGRALGPDDRAYGAVANLLVMAGECV